MASRPKKADLLEKCAELGIEVPDKATVAELAALVEAAEEPEAPEPAPEPREMTVKCDGFKGINLRKAPSKNAPVVGVLDHLSKVRAESVENGWAKVDGGYCMAKFLV